MVNAPFVQISAGVAAIRDRALPRVFALDADGFVWLYDNGEEAWTRLSNKRQEKPASA